MATIIVTTQFHENKAFSEGGEAWKPNGSHDFTFEMNGDVLINIPEKLLIEAISNLVAKESNDLERFEYVSHELKFGQPTKLEGLMEEIDRICNEKQALGQH